MHRILRRAGHVARRPRRLAAAELEFLLSGLDYSAREAPSTIAAATAKAPQVRGSLYRNGDGAGHGFRNDFNAE